MLKWLAPRRSSRRARVDTVTEEWWRGDDRLSLFVIVAYWLLDDQDTDSIFDHGGTSLAAAGFANGWANPLMHSPKRFANIDSHTIDRFVRLSRSGLDGPLVQVRIEETLAYDLPYRSGINATGTSFAIAVRDDSAAFLTDYVRVHQVEDARHRHGAFAIRLPVRRRFAFPEPRGGDDPYASGTADCGALRRIAKFSTDRTEVAAIKDPPSAVASSSDALSEFFASSELLRISLE